MTTERILCVQCAVPLPATAKYCRHCGVSQSEAVPVWSAASAELAKKVALVQQEPVPEIPLPASVPSALPASSASSALAEPPAPVEPPAPADPPAPPRCPTCGEALPHSARTCYEVAPWNSLQVVHRIERAREAIREANVHLELMEKRLKRRAH